MGIFKLRVGQTRTLHGFDVGNRKWGTKNYSISSLSNRLNVPQWVTLGRNRFGREG